MTCQKECQMRHDESEKKIESHSKTLYGSDGIGGIVGCMSRFVTKRGVAIWIVAVLTILGTFVIYGLGVNAEQEKLIHTNFSSIKVHQERFCAIQKDIDEIKTSMQQVKTNQEQLMRERITKQDLKNAFKEAIKEAKE